MELDKVMKDRVWHVIRRHVSLCTSPRADLACDNCELLLTWDGTAEFFESCMRPGDVAMILAAAGYRREL